MPAEWEPHEATWLSWPHNKRTWPGKRLEEVRELYLVMMRHLLASERVHLLVSRRSERDLVMKKLTRQDAAIGSLVIHEVKTTDAWIRDYGPTFVLGARNERIWCKWTFDAWGKKYREARADDLVFRPGAAWLKVPGISSGIVLEGGAIEVNGRGICILNRRCVLDRKRNPGMTPAKMETALRYYLGVRDILWVDGQLEGDDTDGHIDNLVRFASKDTVLVVQPGSAKDPNAPVLRKLWEDLGHAIEKKKLKLKRVRLPAPAPVRDFGKILPASYANFYIANHSVFVPIFNDPADSVALAILGQHFPGRRMIGLPARALVYGLGGIHCVTQQEPAA